MRDIRAICQWLLPLLLLASCAVPPAEEHNVLRQVDAVPDESTAIAIAIAVWAPIYGKDKIASQSPYSAELKDGQWTVMGYLPPGHAGGTAIAVISKVDGQVLRISHGK